MPSPFYVRAFTGLAPDRVVEFNTAKGGTGTTNGTGYGGGIYIGYESGSVIYIDSFTVTNAIKNTDGSGTNGSTANIDGTYIPPNC